MALLDKTMTYEECANYLGILEAGLSDTFIPKKENDKGEEDIILLKVRAALSMAKMVMWDLTVEDVMKKAGDEQ